MATHPAPRLPAGCWRWLVSGLPQTARRQCARNLVHGGLRFGERHRYRYRPCVPRERVSTHDAQGAVPVVDTVDAGRLAGRSALHAASRQASGIGVGTWRTR